MPREKRPHGRQRPGRAPANPFTRASTPVEVIIERIGARGDGVAEAEIQIGWRRRRTPLFVPYTLPGERVVARPVAERGEGVACEPMELLDLAPERVDPPCAHFMSCGGCALQHMAEPAYQAWKRELVVIALRRSTLAEVPVGDLVPCLPGTRRRADFVLQRLGARTVAGFHERGSNRIADLRHCPVLHPDLEALLGALRLAIGPLLEAGDPGEPANRGGELYAEIGQGRYVYTSYAWFRQLRAGVPGAYRQFANLLSLSKAPR